MGKAKLQRMFTKYSENLSVLRTKMPELVPQEIREVNEIFVCPVCGQCFGSDDLEFLSLEHVPPESLGGKVRTITCKKCNNHAGTALDSQLKKFLEFDEFGNVPNIPHEVMYSVNGSEYVPATFSISDSSQFELFGQPKRTNPADIEDIKQRFDANRLDNKITVRFTPYKKECPEVALVRTAYLYAFSILGYSFLLSNNLQVIREQMRDTTKIMLPVWGISKNDFPDETVGINLVVEPEELKSFFVVFDLVTPNKTSSRWGVFLPGPTEPGINVYHRLKKHHDKAIPIRSEHIVSDIDFVTNAFATFDIWNARRV